jgi:hypothetical protein
MERRATSLSMPPPLTGASDFSLSVTTFIERPLEIPVAAGRGRNCPFPDTAVRLRTGCVEVRPAAPPAA